MPPAASDDLNRPYSQSWEDEPTFNTDQNRPIQEHEPSGKSKKKKNKKAKAAAKAVTETPPDNLYASTNLYKENIPPPIPTRTNSHLIQYPNTPGSSRGAFIMS